MLPEIPGRGREGGLEGDARPALLGSPLRSTGLHLLVEGPDPECSGGPGGAAFL